MGCVTFVGVTQPSSQLSQGLYSTWSEMARAALLCGGRSQMAQKGERALSEFVLFESENPSEDSLSIVQSFTRTEGGGGQEQDRSLQPEAPLPLRICQKS